MKNNLFFVAAALCVCAALLSGCQKGKKEVEISGTITVAGEPVDKGAVTFKAVDGATSDGGGRIDKGAFTATVEPGEKKVLVNGSKIVGTYVPDPLYPDRTADQLEDYPGLPFNEEKTIVVEKKKGQTFNIDFAGGEE